MNSNDFFHHIKEKINEELAIFLCKELHIISPSILVASTSLNTAVFRLKTTERKIFFSFYRIDEHVFKDERTNTESFIDVIMMKYVN